MTYPAAEHEEAAEAAEAALEPAETWETEEARGAEDKELADAMAESLEMHRARQAGRDSVAFQKYLLGQRRLAHMTDRHKAHVQEGAFSSASSNYIEDEAMSNLQPGCASADGGSKRGASAMESESGSFESESKRARK